MAAACVGLSPPETCRVEMPLVVPPSTCTLPGGIQYNIQGMTVFPQNQTLRVAQRRPWLEPEFYNSGCAPMYCKDQVQCPLGKIATESPKTRALLDAAFSSNCPFTGNDASPACFQGKCGTYNSTSGWEVTQDQKLRWQTRNDSFGGTC